MDTLAYAVPQEERGFYGVNLSGVSPAIPGSYNPPLTSDETQQFIKIRSDVEAQGWAFMLQRQPMRYVSECETATTGLSEEDDAQDVPRRVSAHERSQLKVGEGHGISTCFMNRSKCFYVRLTGYVIVVMVSLALAVAAYKLLEVNGYLPFSAGTTKSESTPTFQAKFGGRSYEEKETKPWATHNSAQETQDDAPALIRSPDDLHSLVEEINSITIKYLAGDSKPAVDKQVAEKLEKVGTFHVEGPTSEAWLILLLGKTSNLQELVIDIDQLCQGSKIVDRQSLPPITLGEVRRLYIRKAVYCPLLNWISIWKLPKLQTMTLEGVDINRRTYPPLKAFLKESPVSSVRLKNCDICPKCDFSERYRPDMQIEIVTDEPTDSNDSQYEDVFNS